MTTKLAQTQPVADSWSRRPLRDLGQWVGGGTPSKANPQYWENGTVPWVSPKDMKQARISDSEDHITQVAVSESATNLVAAGSVLVVTRSGILRHTLPVAVAGVPVTLNQDLKALTPKSDVLPEYVGWALRAFNQDILHTCSKRGTTVNSIETQRLLDYEIPLAPPEQQKRIVAEIEKQFSRLDEAVANLKRVKANLKRYKAAVLKAAVEGKLTEEWRKAQPDLEPASELLKRILAERRAKWNGKGRYKEPRRPNNNDLPPLPDGWTWATVEQLSSWLPGSVQSGPFGSQLLHSEFISEGVLAIGIDNVGDGTFSIGANHRISTEKYSHLKKFSARPSDVLITVMATVGRVCVLPDNLEPAIVTKHCYRITPATTAITSRFLAMALRADAPTRWHIFGQLRGQTRPGINGPILKNTPVPVPPLLEQELIVAEVERRLSVVEELEVVATANLRRTGRLKQAVLGQAFSGRLLRDSSRESGFHPIVEQQN